MVVRMKLVPSAEQNIPPSISDWEHMLSNANEEEAVNLWQHSILSLGQSQTWGPLVGIAERIMTERGIKFRP
jgi:hypothetical protein